MDALFEAFGVDWKLLLIQVVNFGILILILWRFLYIPVLKVLDERQKQVAKGVEEAAAAHELLSGADAKAKERVQRADQEAGEVVRTAREAAAAERSRLIQEAEARAEAIEKDASLRATEAAAKTIRESEKEIARLAILAAGKALKEKA